MKVWHRFLSMILAVVTVASVVIVMPEEKVEAAGGLTPLQQAVQSVTSEAKGKYRKELNSHFGWNIPQTSWCGYYADYVLRTALARCGYSNYRDYYSSDEMPGATRIARKESNDGRWQAYYSWNNWTYSDRKGYATNNVSSYKPQVGDIVTINTGSDPDPDHTAVICKVYGDNSFQTSDGNTGYSAFRKAHGYEGSVDDMYVRTYDYSRSNSSSAFTGGCGTVVCIVRPYDPTSGSATHSVSELGSPWYPSDDFYAWIVKKDGWVHLESTSAHNVALASGGNNSNYEGQLWRFEKQSNGTYVIYNQADGYVLDAYNLGKSQGTNVQTYSKYNGGGNQQWYLYNTSGGVVIKAVYCDLVLDVNGGSSDPGTNVQLWGYNASAAQQFSVYIVAKRYTTSNFYAYLINKVPWKHLEATAGGNVQIASNGNNSYDPKQVWYMELQSDKSYKITNAYDGKVLDCNNGSNSKGTNVLTYKSGNTSNQRFCLYKVEDEYDNRAGGFIIRPSYSNHLVLDVNGGTADKGTNIQLWNFNFTNAQVFSAYDLKTDGLTYQKPSLPATPVLTAPSSYVVNEEQKISWTNSSLRSDKFDSRIYRIEVTDSSGKVFYSDAGNVTSSGINFNTEGTYKLRVLAVNTKYRDYYSASNTVTCTVSKKSTDLTISSIATQTYTGSAVTPSVTVKSGNKVLNKDTDYFVMYKDYINAGTATVTVTGRGTYAGATATATYKIAPKQISNVTVSMIQASWYDGSAKDPAFFVEDGSVRLAAGTDYTFSYSNNVNAGKGKITITGRGNYTGTKTAEFDIYEDFSSFTISEVSDQTYTGLPVTPSVTVSVKGKTLTKDKDYAVNYKDNTDAGTATVIVSGKGNYAGISSSTFTIKAKPVTSVTVSAIADQTYTGSAIKPSVTVKDGSKILVSGTDYKLTYSNNVNAGTASVKVTGKGNYSGTKVVYFEIIDTKPEPQPTPAPEPVPAVTYTWKKISGKWHYVDQNGNKTTGFATIDGSVYYFNSKGIMLTGWQQVDGVWYYFASSGVMKTGWQKISKKWYYFNDAGMMLTGVQTIAGKTYGFDTSGKMLTGWQKLDGIWYYFLSGGDAVTGWKKISKKWYWFYSDGSMASSETIRIGNKDYKFNSSGVCTNP